MKIEFPWNPVPIANKFGYSNIQLPAVLHIMLARYQGQYRSGYIKWSLQLYTFFYTHCIHKIDHDYGRGTPLKKTLRMGKPFIKKNQLFNRNPTE